MEVFREEGVIGHFFASITTKKIIYIFIFIGFILYYNAFFNDFLWDDYPFIIENTKGHSFNLAQSFTQNIFNTAGYYRPIPALYFSTIYSIFGKNPFFFHIIQISLHIINAILLYHVFARLFKVKNFQQGNVENNLDYKNLSRRQRKKYIKALRLEQRNAYPITLEKGWLPIFVSFILSVLFLVHPLNVESVSYISASQSELFFLFGILATLMSIKEVIRIKDFILIAIFLLLALLTKETSFLFLFMILCFQFLFVEKRLKIFLFIETLVILTYLYIRIIIGGTLFSRVLTVEPNPLAISSLLERLLSVPAILFYYISKTFLPITLIFTQKWFITNLTVKDFYLPLLIDIVFLSLLFIFGLYIYTHKRALWKLFIFFLLWLASGIGMLLQFFPLNLTVADRWMYFPLVGALGMFGIATYLIYGDETNVLARYRVIRKIFPYILLTILILFSIRTIIRNSNYKNEVVLLQHDSKIIPNFIIEDTLGINYAKEGKLDKAKIHFHKSIELYPYANNLFHTGYYYEMEGDIQRAKDFYIKAVNDVRTSSSALYSHALVDVQLYERLAIILILDNDFKLAQKISKEGLLIKPNSEILLRSLAVCENKLHNWSESSRVIMTVEQSFESNLLLQINQDNQELPNEVIPLILGITH